MLFVGVNLLFTIKNSYFAPCLKNVSEKTV